MHDATEPAGAMFVAQDSCHVLVGIAGMDDQRQSGAPRRLDVDAQTLLLFLLALDRVVIV